MESPKESKHLSFVEEEMHRLLAPACYWDLIEVAENGTVRLKREETRDDANEVLSK